MKIRIQKGSIRYRLKQPEVEHFRKNGEITEVLRLGNKEEEYLSFILKRSMVDEVLIENNEKTTIVHVPDRIVLEWTGGEMVGFNALMEISNGIELKVLVEKDFECLDSSEEENVGAYPNPAKQC